MPHDDRPAGACRSVCWFAPLQLLRNAREVAVATVFGRNADARVIEALTAAEAVEPAGSTVHELGSVRGDLWSFHLYVGEEVPFWFDYVADTGDGWDATFTIAYHLAQDSLRLQTADGSHQAVTARGSLLIFGGDQVYPTAGFEAYEQRLILPYRTAFPPVDGEPKNEEQTGHHVSPRLQPHVFAIPGNHDWYDSLVSFTRLFCSKQSFAGWRIPQRRSYFALRLPKGWWLLGTDLQLGSDIDAYQDAFFERIAAEMPATDRVILCHAEPHWLRETIYPDEYAYRSVRRLEERFGDRIKVFLAGDYHFYTRHANAAGVQKIVAGGGGAFLHLTFGPDDARLNADQSSSDMHPVSPATFERHAAFPSRATSLRLCLSGPFVFHARNPSFGLATALGYAVTGEALILPYTTSGTLGELWREAVRRLFIDPFSLFWVATIVLGIVFFTETHKRSYRWIAGSMHGLCHVMAATVLAWASARTTQGWLDQSLWQLPAAAATTAVGGYVVGPLILSVYLTISLAVFRRHRNDASSALRCPDYKSFLRLRIEEHGELTIFPVGIRRVAKWCRKVSHIGDGTRSNLVPVGGSAPFLIEEPIRYPPSHELDAPDGS